jgi:hypothetical protein
MPQNPMEPSTGPLDGIQGVYDVKNSQNFGLDAEGIRHECLTRTQICHWKQAMWHAQGVIDAVESNGAIDGAIRWHPVGVQCKKRPKFRARLRAAKA